MNAPDFATSEAGGVQLQALHTLASLGWRYLTRAEGEAQRRGRLGETMLEDVLAERLHALNPLRQGKARHELPDAAAQEAIRRLRLASADSGKGLLGANEAVTDLLRLGTSVDVTLADGRGDRVTLGRQLSFIDWQTPANNVFHMTAEFAVQREGRPDTRRPDIVLFVNGIRAMRWGELDLNRAKWVIPAERTKMRRPHEVPLSRQALEIIESMRPITGIADYVFPAFHSRTKPISENTVNQALRRLGYQGVMTAHGFRSTASSLLNESERWSPDVIESALAHQDQNAVRATYNRATYWKTRVEMMQWWSDHLDTLRAAAGA